MRREFHMEGDELDDVELDLELEELEELSAIELYNDLELDELEERRYRLELALQRVRDAINQKRGENGE